MSTSAYTPPYKYSAVYRHMSARITPVSSASYTCEGEAGVGGGFAEFFRGGNHCARACK